MFYRRNLAKPCPCRRAGDRRGILLGSAELSRFRMKKMVIAVVAAITCRSGVFPHGGAHKARRRRGRRRSGQTLVPHPKPLIWPRRPGASPTCASICAPMDIHGSGGIFLLPSMDEAKTAAFFQDLAAKCRRPAGKRISTIRYPKRSRRFSIRPNLEPGVYRLENYHREYAVDGKIRFDSDGHEDTTLPEGESFDFTVTGDHLKLLRHLNTRSWYNNIELMNPKRPYGDMTYLYHRHERRPRRADARPAMRTTGRCTQRSRSSAS